MSVTPRDRERFTEGDCHILARAIHRITDWSIASFEIDYEPSDHVFVRLPYRYPRYLDIQGVFTPQAMRREWGMEGVEIGLFTEKEIDYFWEYEDGTTAFRPSCGSWSSARARQLAPQLVEPIQRNLKIR